MINKPYFIFEKGKSAWIELSQASGLMQIKENEKKLKNKVGVEKIKIVYFD